jgi:hypothetical protein
VSHDGQAIVLYCNGPFCGKSKRLATELLETGYTYVRRYQLGILVWRALGGLTEIELDGVLSILGERTAPLCSLTPVIPKSSEATPSRVPAICRAVV